MSTFPDSPPAGVHSIDHFALNVPSLPEAEHFFTAFGLDVMHAGGALDVRAADGHRWARILSSDRKSLAWLSFNCFEGDLPAIARRVSATGAAIISPDDATRSEGIWFSDPDGNLVQVRVGPKTTPDAKAALVPFSAAADCRGSRVRSEVKAVRPRRMSHVLLFTPDVLRAVAFYERALGLRLSDRSDDIIAFTHAAYGSDHHLVAFAKSSAKGWHHVAWDVASIDEVGNGATQMAAAGFKAGWGTGRHVLGSNYFHYVRDPWGSFSEYSADIDFVSAGTPWPAGNFAPEDSLYQWGPDVPEYFVHNTEA
ncbi:VOC family protein [Paraburkholderia aromaticivorans]|uniref:VOC family protein n=1 Tax=Paraburkholderia aromaticivorans TaxID=2026199 RepID=UPI001456266A|nr:VOC family protein [Paraburkholderia aromaticivorans]